MTTPTPDNQTPGSRRSRRRRSVIGGSPHRDEYVRLMENGWSSLAIERYAWHRYGEDVPASTVRSYKARHSIVAKQVFEDVPVDDALDVVSGRAELIRLQQSRIRMDVKLEQGMNKLFSTTRAEIELLARLLTEHKVDLQDLGLLPKAGLTVGVQTQDPGPSRADAPRARTLAEAIGGAVTPEVERQIARVIHLAVPRDAGS